MLHLDFDQQFHHSKGSKVLNKPDARKANLVPVRCAVVAIKSLGDGVKTRALLAGLSEPLPRAWELRREQDCEEATVRTVRLARTKQLDQDFGQRMVETNCTEQTMRGGRDGERTLTAGSNDLGSPSRTVTARCKLVQHAQSCLG